jgi:hypothetical protein
VQGDLRIDRIMAQSSETRDRSFAVGLLGPQTARDVGGAYRREPSQTATPPNIASPLAPRTGAQRAEPRQASSRDDSQST